MTGLGLLAEWRLRVDTGLHDRQLRTLQPFEVFTKPGAIQWAFACDAHTILTQAAEFA
jgi:hypothetical protein